MTLPNLKEYKVVRQIGNGAGSLIFLLRHRETNEWVAAKHVTCATIDLIHSGSPNQSKQRKPDYGGFFEQVANEWKVLSKVESVCRHPGLIQVYNLLPIRRFLRLEGYDLLMEYVEGKSLKDKRDYSIPKLARIYRESASCLGAVHSAEIIHADIKPHHIFVLPDGGVKILDFGQARLKNRQTRKVKIQGTPEYMAPEQLKGLPVDERTDVYLLGVTMFWALTGRSNRPTLKGVPGELGFTVAYGGRYTSLRDFVPLIPPKLEELILSSCERDPAKRPRSMTEVMSTLEEL